MSIILGIDPGSRVTGYGVIRQNGRHLEYLGSGAIRTQVEDTVRRIYSITIKRMKTTALTFASAEMDFSTIWCALLWAV